MQPRTTEPALPDPDARVDGSLSDEALAAMSDEDVEAALTSIPGIGPWTAHGFLLVALDRPDVFLTGDLALRRAVERAYDFDHSPTDEELIQLAERWRPYRSLTVSYLFASEYDQPTGAGNDASPSSAEGSTPGQNEGHTDRHAGKQERQRESRA